MTIHPYPADRWVGANRGAPTLCTGLELCYNRGMDEIKTQLRTFPLVRILLTGLIIGALFSLFADLGKLGLGGDFLLRALERIGCSIAGGLAGWVLNLLTAGFTGIGLNMVRGTGFEFSDDVETKLLNTFIFVCAIVGAAISLIFLK